LYIEFNKKENIVKYLSKNYSKAKHRFYQACKSTRDH